MPRHLKSAQLKPQQSNAAVRQTVERMLAEIAEQGDEAVRRYARELDKWDGPVEITYRDLTVTVSGDVAHCYGLVHTRTSHGGAEAPCQNPDAA